MVTGKRATLEKTAGLGVQSLGTAARFGRQGAALARQYKYQIGQPSGEWTPGTSGGVETPYGSAFGGGSFAGGQTGFGLEGQLSNLAGMKDLNLNLRALNETMIKSERGYQAKQIGFAMESANLSYRQGMENIAFQEKQFGVQRAYQRKEMTIQGQQMTTQQSWQRADLAYQQDVAGLQYGWGQEDYTRSIRFATGRERQQLKREQGRSQVMYSMEEGQRGRERQRFETSADWQQQALTRQKEYFEQTSALQEEQFTLQKQHLTEQHDLQMRQIAAQMAHLNEMNGLQDQQRKLENDWQDKQAEYQKTEIENEITLAKAQQADSQAELAADIALAAQRGKYSEEQIAAISPGGSLWDAWQAFVDLMKSTIEDLKNAAKNGSGDGDGGGGGEGSSGGGGGGSVEKKATGGYINRTGKAIVHAGEYVMSAGEVQGTRQRQVNLPDFAPQRAQGGATLVKVYLGSKELEQLVVDVSHQPAFIAATQDNGRRLANRRIG